MTSALTKPDIRDRDAFVYGLFDPVLNQCRYIGRSASPENRLNSHESRSASDGVRKWVAALHAAGMRPVMRVLRRVPAGKDSAAAELEEIERHKSTILNVRGVRAVRFRVGNSPANRAAQALACCGLSAKEIADRIGADQPRLCRWMSGKRLPCLEAAVRAEAEFGIPPRWWLEAPTTSVVAA